MGALGVYWCKAGLHSRPLIIHIAPIPLIIMPVMEWRRVALMSYENQSSGYFSDDKSMTLV